MARTLGFDVELVHAPIEELPFADGEFDGAVCLSVLEHLRDLDTPLRELRRVLAPGAVAVLGFPVRNVVTDMFFRVAGYAPREIHPSSHLDILGAIESSGGFTLDRVAHSPSALPMRLAGYVVCRARAR
jgi:ubiquinone/menaquinone biosynthesis C-methylase UbiE